MPSDGEITKLLAAMNAGDRGALDRLVPRVYEQLKRIAHRQRAFERGDGGLETTTLVHEAYVEVAGLERITWADRAHFFAVAARAMRRLLIDDAVRRNAQKRGGGWTRLALEDAPLAVAARSDELLALEDALRRLELLEERQARVVECRFFGGMSVDETACALGVSPATVKRDWTAARAWLNRELSA